MDNPSSADAEKVIDSNFDRIFSVNDVADLLHCNYHTLREVFSREKGISMQQYLYMLRCKYVKRYLRETNWKLFKIAVTTGFKDDRQMIRVFQKYTGITPENYRKNNR